VARSGLLFSTPAVAGAMGSGVLGLVCAFALRSGAWLRSLDVAVVTREGREVSRLRAAGRAALAWSWVPLQLVVGPYAAATVGIKLLTIASLLDAAFHPARGVHDRIAGTYLVPR